MWMILSTALASPSVLGTHVSEGKLKDRIVDTPVDVVLLYGGEQRGSLADCGCPNNPRGSIGRVEAYAEAVRATGSPTFVLNAGNWLNDPVGSGSALRADAMVQNAHMVAAVEAGSWDVLNVSFRDLPYLGTTDHFPVGSVSANARGREGLATHVLLEADDLRIAVTGVTKWSKDYLQPQDVKRLDPVSALAELLPTLHEEADLVVVLAFGLGRDVKSVAELDIDVLIEADGINIRMDPIAFGDTLWLRSNDQTQLLGELRLTVKDGKIVRAFDRAIDLDASIPISSQWRRRDKKAHAAVKKAQQRLLAL